MIVNKTVLGEIDKCYATCLYEGKAGLVAIGCSEGPSEARAYIDGKETSIWTDVGGTMNFVHIPGRENEFYATRRFVPLFQAAECELNYVKYDGEKWTVKPLMKFPYLHRFDFYTKDGDIYFFGCTLCKSKEFPQDWSTCGSVYTGKLDKDPSQPFGYRELYYGITKNHGLCHCDNLNGKECFIASGVEGAFAFYIPENPEKDEWKIEKIIETETSDVAVCDVNNDGQVEIAAIQPFHGNKCRIYKVCDGKVVQDFEYDIDFGHVIWGGRISDKNCFLLGYRRLDMRLYAITFRNGAYFMQMIDEKVGPSQISVVGNNVLAANRQINQLALYNIEL